MEELDRAAPRLKLIIGLSETQLCFHLTLQIVNPDEEDHGCEGKIPNVICMVFHTKFTMYITWRFSTRNSSICYCDDRT